MLHTGLIILISILSFLIVLFFTILIIFLIKNKASSKSLSEENFYLTEEFLKVSDEVIGDVERIKNSIDNSVLQFEAYSKANELNVNKIEDLNNLFNEMSANYFEKKTIDVDTYKIFLFKKGIIEEAYKEKGDEIFEPFSQNNHAILKNDELNYSFKDYNYSPSREIDLKDNQSNYIVYKTQQIALHSQSKLLDSEEEVNEMNKEEQLDFINNFLNN